MKPILFLCTILFSFTCWGSFFPSSIINEHQLKSVQKRNLVLETPEFIVDFERKMSPLVSSQGGILEIFLSSEQSMNAKATREQFDGKELWLIEVHQGLLTSKNLTEDEILLVLCHELGHHLAGPPKAQRGGWASCEGQADYWATANCFRQVVRSNVSVENISLNLTTHYSQLSFKSPPSLNRRSTTEVLRINYGYPSPQCRLDTLLAGYYGDRRPNCWFVD